ncbi:hypothetical protein AZA_77034 [Nitrospirillum viridazoti Y2]|nr:hypothetical protein AZA_77034 [Nitrospirillum amazonense Y2]
MAQRRPARATNGLTGVPPFSAEASGPHRRRGKNTPKRRFQEAASGGAGDRDLAPAQTFKGASAGFVVSQDRASFQASRPRIASQRTWLAAARNPGATPRPGEGRARILVVANSR